MQIDRLELWNSPYVFHIYRKRLIKMLKPVILEICNSALKSAILYEMYLYCGSRQTGLQASYLTPLIYTVLGRHVQIIAFIRVTSNGNHNGVSSRTNGR